MPFNKIAELGVEIGKAQLILESKDNQIKALQEENQTLNTAVQELRARITKMNTPPPNPVPTGGSNSAPL
jgi:uncharacterized protein involved in exopolysaccharide biosynthesis